MSQAQHECRVRRRAATVNAFEFSRPDFDPRVAFEGTASCKSCLCPLCVLKWQVTRCDEIKQAIDNWEAKHGPGCVKFPTLTPRHHRGMSLGLLHRLNTKAFGDFYSGRKGQDFARKISGFVHLVEGSGDACAGIGADAIGAPAAQRRWRRACSSGDACTAPGELSDPIDQDAVPFTRPESIRAHDQTWSPVHGWHPHIHALVFLAWQGESDESLEELFFARWLETLLGALASFRRLVARILSGEKCAIHKRHQSRMQRYVPPARAPETCTLAPASWVQRWDDAIAVGKATELECCAGGARDLDGSIVSPVETTRRSRERIRRSAERGENLRGAAFAAEPCRRGEPRRHPTPEDRIAQASEWQTIAGVESCPACAAGRDCPNLRDRAEHVFGVRLVRAHVPLRDSMRVIERALRRFDEKALKPRRSYGCKLETVRDNEKIDTYLTKLGAMGFELAFSTTKNRPTSGELGSIRGDGHRHYGKWEVGLISTLRRDPLKEECREAWGELFRGTFGTQLITFSSRERLGLGPDPYADDQEPDEQREGETKRYLGDIPAERWDAAAAALSHDWLIVLGRAYHQGKLFQYLEAPTEAYERARGPPAFDAEEQPRRTRLQRETETSEAFRRALDPTAAQQKIEARRNADPARNGEGVSDESDFQKRKELAAAFGRMRDEYVANVIAANDPAKMRIVAERMRQDGWPEHAGALERAASRVVVS